ncbi:hypothetical protein [Arthrobacter sedimenti]|uniref:Uncharacterized protein n=1 Tax=Arthrobacter sedimenti TaxID=2694931 RepID=A0ABV8WEV1_9MICC
MLARVHPGAGCVLPVDVVSHPFGTVQDVVADRGGGIGPSPA